MNSHNQLTAGALATIFGWDTPAYREGIEEVRHLNS